MTPSAAIETTGIASSEMADYFLAGSTGSTQRAIETSPYTNEPISIKLSTYATWPFGRVARRALDSVASSNALTSEAYRATVERLRSLLQEEDEEDRPTEYASAQATRLLRDLAGSLGMQFPLATVVVGPDRSVRLLWARSDREVRVSLGGTEANRSYVYWRTHDSSGVEDGIDWRVVRQSLSWLSQGV